MILSGFTHRNSSEIPTRIRRRRRQSLRQRNRPETRVKSTASRCRAIRCDICRGLEDRCRACGRCRPVLSVVGDCETASATAAPARNELDARPADDRAIILRIRGDAADLCRECGGAVGVGEEGGRGGGVGDEGGVHRYSRRRPARQPPSSSSQSRPRGRLRHYLRVLPYRAIYRHCQRRPAPALRPTARNPHLRASEPRRSGPVFLEQSRAGIHHPASKYTHPSVRIARRSRRGCRHRIIPCAYRDDLLRGFIAYDFIHFCHYAGRIRNRAPRHPAVRGGGQGGGRGGEFAGDGKTGGDADGAGDDGVHQPAITAHQERHLSRRQRPTTIRDYRIHIFYWHPRHHRAHRPPRSRIRDGHPALRLVVIKTPEVQNRRVR